jgi:hypothetical protein
MASERGGKMKFTDTQRLDWLLERVVVGDRVIFIDPIPAFGDIQLLFQRRQAIDSAMKSERRGK